MSNKFLLAVSRVYLAECIFFECSAKMSRQTFPDAHVVNCSVFRQYRGSLLVSGKSVHHTLLQIVQEST